MVLEWMAQSRETEHTRERFVTPKHREIKRTVSRILAEFRRGKMTIKFAEI